MLESMYSGNGQTVEKPVVYFKETKKGVVLCKTLAYQVADILGSTDTSTWAGQQITLVPDTLMVAGKPRSVIRARKVDYPTFPIPPSPLGAISPLDPQDQGGTQGGSGEGSEVPVEITDALG
jgi:hypothetical protein